MEKYVNETYGMNLDLDITQTPYGSLQEKMSLVYSSGEKWDLCWAGNWSNSFTQGAANGAFLDISELAPKYAPNLYDFVDIYWASTTINGGIYAVPNIQLEYTCNFATIPTKWVEMYNAANPDTPVANGTTEDLLALEDFWFWSKENIIDAGVDFNGVVPKYGLRNGVGTSCAAAWGMEDIGVTALYFKLGDESCKVYTGFDFDQYYDGLMMSNRLYNAGIIPSDAVGREWSNGDWALLEVMTQFHPSFKPGEAQNQYSYWALDESKNELTFLEFGDHWAKFNFPIATVTCVNAKCERPDIVLKFLDILNTDPELFNLICFGIEGTHYTLDENGCVIPSEENTGYDPNNDWGFGNQFLAHPRKGQPGDIWEITAANNAAAIPSCAMGFSPSTDNIETQIANVNVVNAQYNSTVTSGALMCSQEDWAAYVQQYIDDMYAAGLQDMVDDMQAQVDAWLATK